MGIEMELEFRKMKRNGKTMGSWSHLVTNRVAATMGTGPDFDAFRRKMSNFVPWNTCRSNDMTRYQPS